VKPKLIRISSERIVMTMIHKLQLYVTLWTAQNVALSHFAGLGSLYTRLHSPPSIYSASSLIVPVENFISIHIELSVYNP